MLIRCDQFKEQMKRCLNSHSQVLIYSSSLKRTEYDLLMYVDVYVLGSQWYEIKWACELSWVISDWFEKSWIVSLGVGEWSWMRCEDLFYWSLVSFFSPDFFLLVLMRYKITFLFSFFWSWLENPVVLFFDYKSSWLRSRWTQTKLEIFFFFLLIIIIIIIIRSVGRDCLSS